jgi:hypothetical protein
MTTHHLHTRAARVRFAAFGLIGLALSAACGELPVTAEPDAVEAAPAPLTGATERAIILVDRRLYTPLAATIDEYRAVAERRRGFTIGLRIVDNLDNMTHAQVRAYVVQQRTANPNIEGVLFMGNIKLPSFYKTRNDIILTRLYPAYYEDLDAVFTKHYANGALDPVCDGTNEPWCVVAGSAYTVPPHDFDGIAKGPNADPEIWASFMPVGVSGTSNTYTDFANQLRPYLTKVINFYKLQAASVTNGRYYFVSNDRGETFDITWNAFGKSNIDFYGKPGPNGETDWACGQDVNNLCYKRWPTETYASYAAFEADYVSKPWVGEGWQNPDIFKGHMNGARFDVVEVNVHSSDQGSIITTPEARALTKAGLVVTLAGCGVAGFAQPGSPSGVDNPWTLASDNIALGYLYGSSSALAALGDPHWRGHYAQFPKIYQALKGKTYLGKAHMAQMKALYAIAGTNPLELREHAGEMLLGDPFMDLSGYFDGFDAGTPRWTVASGSWSVVTDGSLVYKQANTTGVARSVTGESTWTAVKVQARMKALAFTGTDNLISLVGRYKDDGNFYQLALRPTKIELRKVVGGAWTTLASATSTLTTGTWYTVRLEASGTSLKAFVNGAQKLSVTDASHATGRAGFGTFNGSAEFDDLTITP